MVYVLTHWITLRIICLLGLTSIIRAYTTYYMDEYPLNKNTKTITLGYTNSMDSAVILKASRKRFPSTGTYQIILKPPLEYYEIYGLVGTVQKFNLSRDKIFCIDHIEIWKIIGSSKERHYSGCLSKPDTFKTNEINKFHANTRESVSITLYIGQSINELEGFEIIISTFRRCGYLNQMEAKPHEISCSNSTCVYKELRCDSRDNCGNNHDEYKDLCASSTSPSEIGIIMGILIFIVICMAIGLKRFFKQKANSNDSNNASTLPDQSQPSAPYRHHQNPYYIQPQVQMPQPWTDPYPQPIANKPPEYNDPPPPYYTVVNSSQ